MKGIQLEYIVPKTPELNEMAERINWTVMERTWSMLAHAKLFKVFWVEVFIEVIGVVLYFGQPHREDRERFVFRPNRVGLDLPCTIIYKCDEITRAYS